MRFLPIFAAVGCLAFSVSAQAETWKHVWTDPEGNGDGYIDKDSIKRDGQYRLIAYKLVPAHPDDFETAVFTMKFDCVARTGAMTSIANYDVNGVEVFHIPIPKEEQEMGPVDETSAENGLLIEAACR